nr:MAG TPA: tail tube protein [Caudoviricetes sp.]
MDIRLKTKTMELDGKTFELCCNFNVIADAEDLYGGLGALLRSGSSMNTVRTFLACMMNDYADSMGWEERYTPRQAGRLLSTNPQELRSQAADIMALVFSAVTAERPTAAGAEAEGEEPEKN